MDKTAPEHQIIGWHEQACSDDSNRASDVRIPAHCLSEVSVSTDKKYAAVIAVTTVYFI